MFTMIIVRGFAHRLLENGLVESAPVHTESVISELDWQFRSDSSMNLNGWEKDKIRVELDTIRTMIPNDYILPPQPSKKQEQDLAYSPV